MFSGFQFRHAQYLYLLTMLVPLALLCYWLIERRRQQLVRLLGEQAALRAARAVKYHRLRAICLLLAVAAGFIALARPQWGEYQTVAQSGGVDAIIAVDVSLSMLADDESPTRLARARLLATDLIERLNGNRIGMIAFAGTNAGLMPLTLDTRALKSFIETLNGRAVDNPSTSLVNVIRRATQSFKAVGKQSRVLILISDGEDQSEDPVGTVRSAALEAVDNGIVIITVGVGSTKGSNIPLAAIGASGLKMDLEGKPVVTSLDEGVLQTAAEVSGGVYLHTQPDSSEAGLIANYIDKLNKGELTERVVRDRAERFHYPLILAIMFLMVDFLLLYYSSIGNSNKNPQADKLKS